MKIVIGFFLKPWGKQSSILVHHFIFIGKINQLVIFHKACSKKSKNVNNKEDEVSQDSESDSQLVEKNVKTGQVEEVKMNSDKSDEESESQSQSKPCLSKNLATTKKRHDELNYLKKDKLIEKIIKLEDDLVEAIKIKENCLVSFNIVIHKVSFEI
jgi:hypothetical protein